MPDEVAVFFSAFRSDCEGVAQALRNNGISATAERTKRGRWITSVPQSDRERALKLVYQGMVAEGK